MPNHVVPTEVKDLEYASQFDFVTALCKVKHGDKAVRRAGMVTAYGLLLFPPINGRRAAPTLWDGSGELSLFALDTHGNR